MASLPGRKGKAKMKILYRSVGATYHEESRAKSLIDSLDMQYLLDNAPVPLYKIEEEIFCNLQKQIELNFFVKFSLHFAVLNCYLHIFFVNPFPLSLALTAKTRYNYLAEDVASSRKAGVNIESN